MRDRMLLGDDLTLNPQSAEELRRIANEIEIANDDAYRSCLARLDNPEVTELTISDQFAAKLRDYQRDGVRWMHRISQWGFGGILADDMGLGKTVQTLAMLDTRRDVGPTLIVAPTSVTYNWMRECERFTPHLKAKLYREANRNQLLVGLKAGDIVVSSYGLALRDAEELQAQHWGTVVLDEAQMVKNSQSKTSQALTKLKSDWTLALTGTPIENHLGELWSIFRLVAPGVFGSWQKFSKQFGTPIECRGDFEARDRLRERIRPFVLRRTKGEVLKELPPRTEINEFVDLSEAERAIYDRIRLSILGEVDAIAKIPNLESERFKLLALLTRLRQVACHVGLVHEQWKGSSAKMLALRERMLALREEGHRVLIFSQFTSHLNLIRKMFKKEKITYRYLDGSTVAKARQTEVDAFQKGDDTAFLISLKAGGTGLNLTAADYVIHMDPWWNPAVESQATDRAHRIGQTKPVMVYRMIARNTIEEEILKLHETKRNLVDGVLSGSDSSSSLSIRELVQLIRH
jgi:SNF2 family DNA or RNA helicase